MVTIGCHDDHDDLIFILAEFGEAVCNSLEGDTHVTMDHKVLTGTLNGSISVTRTE